MKLPYGYHRYGDIVLCLRCERQWHIPSAMAVLTRNAWHVLAQHRDGHEVRRPLVRRQIMIPRSMRGR